MLELGEFLEMRAPERVEALLAYLREQDKTLEAGAVYPYVPAECLISKAFVAEQGAHWARQAADSCYVRGSHINAMRALLFAQSVLAEPDAGREHLRVTTAVDRVYDVLCEVERLVAKQARRQARKDAAEARRQLHKEPAMQTLPKRGTFAQ